MPINNRQDFVILDLIQQAVRNVRAMPVNLGGVSGVGGGEGTPPGGFIGLLAQTKVAYDTTEAAYLGISAGSGTLVDNLAHIRYRLNSLETGSGASPLLVDDWDGNPSIANTSHLTFSGVVVTDLGGGHALITVASGGGGTALTVKDVDNSPTITNVDTIIFSGFIVTDMGSGDVLVTPQSNCPVFDNLTTQITGSGSHFTLQTVSTCGSGILLFYNGIYQPQSLFTMDVGDAGLTTSFTPLSGDTLVAVYNLGGGGGGGGSGTDSNAIHTNSSSEISGLTEKTSIASNDVFVIEDSASSFSKKKVKESTLISSIWNQVVNESGASFANWTSVSGSWSSDGTVIKQTNTSSTTSKARITSPVANAGFVFQTDVQFKTNAADAHVGVLIHFTGGTNSIFVYPRLQEDDVRVEQEGTAQASLYTGYTINIDTWYTLRVVTFGNVIDTYLDGVLVGSTVITQINAAGRYIGLATTNTEGWYRNIKAWNLALPA